MTDLRSELLQIRQERGEVYPALAYEVVKEDREEWPALDGLIGEDWDDAIAGPKWRVEKIRHGMKRVFGVQYKGEGKAPADLSQWRGRSFYAVPVPHRPQPTWEPVESVIADPKMRELVLQEMYRRINELTERYQEFDEFVPAMLKALRAVQREQRKAKAS